MYSVLIVDDEKPVREAIKLLCSWDDFCITQINEACDGKAALEFLCKKNIDIIFLDMNMPEMDGIEFLRCVQKKQFEVIVISGYDNFDYAYEALKFKAVDYLLKPLVKSKLNEALKKAIDKLNETKKQKDGLQKINQMLNMTLPVLKEKIYFAAIERMLSPTEKQAYADIMNPNSEYQYFGVIVLRILYSYDPKYRTEKNFESAEKILKSISEKFESCFYFVNPIQNDERIVVLNLRNNKMQAVEELSRQFCQVLSYYPNLKITVLSEIGCLQKDILNLYESYDFAKRKLRQINLLNNRNGQNILPKQMIAKSLISSLSLFQDAIEKGSFQYLQNQLDEYLEAFLKTGYLSLEYADRMLSELDLMFRDIAAENDLKQSEIMEISNSIPLYYSSFEEFKKMMTKLASTYYTAIRKQIKSRNCFEVCEIKKYIDHRFFEKISISIFSKKYFLSREYIMKLFKKEFGCGIYEYVLKVRMANAKRLISDPNIKIQDVAQMVGYRDSNYFSKAFRNYYGMSPTTFQESLE